MDLVLNCVLVSFSFASGVAEPSVPAILEQTVVTKLGKMSHSLNHCLG